MHHEQEAMERQNMLDEINILKTMLQDMESDFLKCAKGRSPCFFCAHDDTCTCTNDSDCNFKWLPHN